MKSLNIQIPEVYQYYFQNLYKYRYYLISGGRNSAKSYTAGGLSCLIEASVKKEKILCLREIQKSIDESVHDLLSGLIEQYKFPNFKICKDYILNVKNGSLFLFEGMYRNIEKIKSIPEITKVFFEEADKISQASLDLLLPTVREQGSRLLFIWNPQFETDAIHQEFMINKKPNAYYLHTTYKDNPFISQTSLDEINYIKETNYKQYCTEFLGELKTLGDDFLLDVTDYLNAVDRNVNDDGAIEYGLDLARYGSDSSVLSKRKGLVLKEIKEKNQLNEVEIINWVKFEVGNKRDLIKIDLGYMPGVYDHLKADGYNVIGYNFGENAKNKDRYANLVSEMWAEFKDNINKIKLIKNERLKQEMTTRKYKIDNKGRFKIESKDDFKTRYKRSCDVMDSVLLCYYKPKIQNHYSFV
jgi:phage terminase large subunit